MIRSFSLVPALAAAAFTWQCAHAQIRTDGSLGGAAQSMQGPNYVLPQSLGRLAGNNLFHSFSIFNINTGESATFTTSTSGIANVISRVTGGAPSTINGQLSLHAADGAPSFFFINPAGVVFGSGAAIDVPGGFHVGTADYIAFADGKFFADLKSTSTFSSAPPEAFGFLGSGRGLIAVSESAKLSARPFQPLSLIGGDIAVDGEVSAAGGDLRVVALGQQVQEVGFVGPLPASQGALNIRGGGRISSFSSDAIDAGSIRLSAGRIVINGLGLETGVFSEATGVRNGGDVDVLASGDLILLNGGALSATAWSSGNAGAVRVNAGSIAIDARNRGIPTGILSRAVSGTGAAGTVEVTISGNLSIAGGGEISSFTSSAGNAGAVRVSAANIGIDGTGSDTDTGIFSTAGSGSSGNAGTIEVTTPGSLSMRNGARITSDTSGAGNGGSIRVIAGNITMDGADSDLSTGISSDANDGSTGNAGNVEVRATGRLSILNTAFISSDAYSSGNAGSVNVNAASITIDGARGGDFFTGISSEANASGHAGSVVVSATGDISIVNGGQISSDTYGSGNAGTVKVSADSMTIDSGGVSFTGITSDANEGSTGNAGNVEIAVTGRLLIRNAGDISSDAYSTGNAGTVKVTAGSLTIDEANSDSFTGISSDAISGSSGNAGDVLVTVTGDLVLLNGGKISSSTDGTGNAGSVTVVADRLSLVRGGLIFSDTFSAGNAGAVDVRARSIAIDSGNGPLFTGISSESNAGSLGRAGDVKVTATEDLSIINGARITSSTFSPGTAGSVGVQAGSLSILHGGEISSSTYSSGDAGSVKVVAGAIRIDSQGFSGFATGILSQAERGSTGKAGDVDVTATGDLSIVNGGDISSSTFSVGDAGSVKVAAGQLDIDSQGWSTFGTGIFSTSVGGRGNAGTIEVVTTGNISVVNGGRISSSTFSSGNAGSVKVAGGSVVIDSRGFTAFETGIFSTANAGSGGNAGSVDVTAQGPLTIVNGGQISSSTTSAGGAGSVKVSAGSIEIDNRGSTQFATGIFSTANAGSGGDAGTVDVMTEGRLTIVNGGQISSSTSSVGDAGSVKVDAGSIAIDRQGSARDTGIFSRAESGSAGSAGSVEVTARDDLALRDGASISSSTASTGDAGSVAVTAGTLLVDGRHDANHPSTINATAEAGSSGQTGSVVVRGTTAIALSNGGELSITNFARVGAPDSVVPTLLTVVAPQINLLDGGQITAASSGNVAASDVRIDFGALLSLTHGAITTSAQDGNGGSIQIAGDGVLVLRDSQITTSVAGLSGNGGNISVRAKGLVMETGFIQANTAASNARGGDVAIDVEMLVPSGNSLFVGGQTPYVYQTGVFGLNVIQAAAPTGVSGTIDITTPVLDVSGGLSGLSTKVIDTGGLGRSLCQASGGSSLAQTGRGGLAPSARDLLRVDPAPAAPARSTSATPPIFLSSLGCPL